MMDGVNDGNSYASTFFFPVLFLTYCSEMDIKQFQPVTLFLPIARRKHSILVTFEAKQ